MMDGSSQKYPACAPITKGADIPADVYGARASAIQGLVEHGFPVPKAWAISCETVKQFTAKGFVVDFDLEDLFEDTHLLSVRSSAQDRAWGGPETLLNIGINAKKAKSLAKTLGAKTAYSLFYKFITDYAVMVARLDGEDFDLILEEAEAAGETDYEHAVDRALGFYHAEMDAPFPDCPVKQLRHVLRSLATSWNGPSAKILRAARGAPADADLGLIVQRMALGVGKGGYGSGVAQFVSRTRGTKTAHGRYLSQSQGREAVAEKSAATFLAKDERGTSLEEEYPELFKQLTDLGEQVRRVLKNDMKLEFTVEDDYIWLLDATPAERNGRAAVEIAVRLAEDGLISKEEALMSIAPTSLNESLHPQVSRKAKVEIIASGIGASPGAATGKIVFTAAAALASEARGDACILVRVETGPDDIRGMHSAKGILTERGGITSHAAVVARGLGLPCVVGAENSKIDMRKREVVLSDGEVLSAGDVITLVGDTGEVLRGAPKLVEPDLGGAILEFMSWADEFRTLSVRGNADTPADFRMARAFGVDGIGLVRTEHMFFDADRITVMRELIFADTEDGRRDALGLLLPMQRDDFVEMFTLMGDLPVCIRLLDPPLHEFLPSSRDEMQALAENMDLPLSKVIARIEDLQEFNPMLGTRGVRLGITAPAIYEMQARAIFEAAALVEKKNGLKVKPEIMIPLVSARREVDLIKARVDVMATEVEAQTNIEVQYEIGVMVETPRAALRANNIAETCSFLSFGTNDLTQMTYGLSRDDAGRFMSVYVNNDVFPEDPFHRLDEEGVGELMEIAVERARNAKPSIKLGLCGEHGGDSASVKFCHSLGLDYVSCSAFRTPIAKLAAAQAALAQKAREQQKN